MTAITSEANRHSSHRLLCAIALIVVALPNVLAIPYRGIGA